MRRWAQPGDRGDGEPATWAYPGAPIPGGRSGGDSASKMRRAHQLTAQAPGQVQPAGPTESPAVRARSARQAAEITGEATV